MSVTARGHEVFQWKARLWAASLALVVLIASVHSLLHLPSHDAEDMDCGNSVSLHGTQFHHGTGLGHDCWGCRSSHHFIGGIDLVTTAIPDPAPLRLALNDQSDRSATAVPRQDAGRAPPRS